ncbi:hypothetical protein CLONEX_03398 [[Clostridium] nexile DSM 1787]|nr:hypothetical protein CLONEX_03398 [[Clostridium] nexile DSM 1787]
MIKLRSGGSIICRFINQLQLELRQMLNRDMHRYEHPHINEVLYSIISKTT